MHLPEQALYLKWRPQSFADVIGQDHITRTLRNSLIRGRIRHAYLFSGPRGTGKTTTARLLAKAVNCRDDDASIAPCNACGSCHAINEGRFLDLIEIDAASHTGVDDVRELRDKIAFAPGEGLYKVYIIDEVHRFSGNAFDALLKTLEEPPDHAIFVLATTEIDKVPATIKSRCLQFEFRLVSQQEVSERLAAIAESESLSIEREALDLIARRGAGSVRDSIGLLDQIVTDPAEAVSLALTQKLLGTATSAFVRDFVDAVAQEDVALGIHIINNAIDSGSDPRQFGKQIVESLRNVMLAQTASADLVEASQEERDRFAQLAQEFNRSRLLKTIRAFNEAINAYTGGWQPQLALELALIESLQQPLVQSSPIVSEAARVPAKARLEAAKDAKESDLESDAGRTYERAPASAPGEPPAYSVLKIHEGWMQVLTRVHQYSRNIPPLLEHAHVRAIEGNRLILGVQAGIFQEKIAAPERARVIEQAIFDLHDVKLRIEVQVVDQVIEPQEADEAGKIEEEDPLISAGKLLGGVVDDSE
jgi:DNA polymerase-3 subunit gamma/tau